MDRIFLPHGDAWLDTACRRTPQHILVNMHHERTRVCIYVGHMVVSTVLGPPWARRASLRLLGGFHPLTVPPRPPSPPLESPHEFSMRLAAHLCQDRPHRHHRPWTKLVNLLTARTFSTGVATVLSPSPHYSVCTPYMHLPHKLISAFCRPAPRCVTIIENTRFLVTQHHMVAFKIVIDHISLPECLLTPIHRLEFFIT